jgi:hypothetical protein
MKNIIRRILIGEVLTTVILGTLLAVSYRLAACNPSDECFSPNYDIAYIFAAVACAVILVTFVLLRVYSDN